MSAAAIWVVCGLTMAGVIVRPFRIAEWQWALLGAFVLVIAGLTPAASAFHALSNGLDVYMFLAGMLLLAELARVQGLFDWVAARMLPLAAGSQRRLFAGTFAVGVVVTALLSNDATILLLTPALLAAARQARVDPLPYAFSCAFVANAASFVLPISNPANLLVFRALPGPAQWFAAFGLPALASVAVTFGVLNAIYGRTLAPRYATGGEAPLLSPLAKIAALLIAASAGLVLAAAAYSWPVGGCALGTGIASVTVVALFDRQSANKALRHAQWSIVPLVAGLFVIVDALDRTGVLSAARTFLRFSGALHPALGNLLVGASVTLADTILNNLPVGVIARYAVAGHGLAAHIVRAVLVGVDLGPNLSASGSLATLLWIAALRRERLSVSPWQFFLVGIVVTVPALALALLAVR